MISFWDYESLCIAFSRQRPVGSDRRDARAARYICAHAGAGAHRKSLAPGKWTAREIVCHLADCEIVFSYRLRQTLAEEHHVIQPFDQDKFAKVYAAYDAPAALAVFSALRRWNISFIHAVPADAFSKRVKHPERGEMTFKDIVETMGGHDLNHVKQLEAIAARQ